MSREGYKMTELGEIPQDWEVKPVREVAEVNPERLGSRTDKNLIINYIDIESVNTGKIANVKELTFGEAPSRARRKVRQDDVIISTVRPYLKAFTLIKNSTENLVCSKGFAVLRAKNNSLPQYIYQCTLSNSFLNQLSNKMVGSNYPAVNSSDVKETLMPVPPLSEQKKIADILYTFDIQMEQTDALIDKLNLLKKGLMQRLLTNGIGHTQFKDTVVGRIPKEWKVMTLGKIGKTYSGLSDKTKNDFGNGKPFIPYKNVFGNSKVDINSFQYVSIKDGENQNRVEYGDILFTASSETPKEVGMSSVMLDRVDELYLNSFCFGYRLFDLNMLIPEFAQYLFRGVRVRKIMSALGQGSTRYNISRNEVMKIKIPIPCIEEQIKIANILSSIDESINKTCAIKQNLIKAKKELAEKLLTGIIRVK